VVLAIDISGSMDARDFETPDGERKQRLEAVRDVVRAFVAGREGDRMALIVFGTRAYGQAPLTEDLGTIISLLDRTEVGMAGPQTALGDAIGLAIRTFEASDIEQRLLILLTDGNDTASRMSPVNAAEIARQQDVEIFTIGVGDPDASGEDRVDLATLQDIAARTGGEFFFAGDEAALREVYERINALAPREVETLSYRPRQSLAWIPLALAALIGTLTVAYLAFGARRRSAA
jgi:Ca-activated chloride channel family protein